VAVCDPLLLLLNCEAGEELGTSVWSRWNVYDATEDVGDLEAQQAEGHVCETFAFFGEVGHVGMQVKVIDVEGLELCQHNYVSFLNVTYHLSIELCFHDGRVAAVVFRRPGVENADLPP
jgi:hypothetical protein